MAACIHAPSIDSVEIIGLHVRKLASVFRVFGGGEARRLRSLRLSHIFGYDSDTRGFSKTPVLTPLAVDSLDVVGDDPPLLGLLKRTRPLVDISHLRHLRLDMGIALLEEWFKMCGHSLTQLDLRFSDAAWRWGEAPAPWPPVDFPATTQLRLLRFEFSVPRVQVLGAISNTLSALSAPNLVEIVFLSGQDTDLQTTDTPDPDPGWSDVDSVISGSFPSVSVVRFILGMGSPFEERQLRLREQLPRLHNSGVLVIV
ncbi:hypothetical protein B0H11DRAFT_1031347 [Mycena galericulata]|nr:hypothetical protein B0H11DRAFT_1031347 [Mycena galericulata]